MLFNCLAIILFANCIMYSIAVKLFVRCVPGEDLEDLEPIDYTFEETDWDTVNTNVEKRVGYIIPWEIFVAKFKNADKLKHPLKDQGKWETKVISQSPYELLRVEVDGSTYSKDEKDEYKKSKFGIGFFKGKGPWQRLFHDDNGTGQRYFYTEGSFN